MVDSNKFPLDKSSSDIEQALKYAEDFSVLYNAHKTQRKALDIANLQINEYAKNEDMSYERLSKVYLSALECLSIAAEYKDEDTGKHIQRMSGYSQILAKNYGLSDEAIDMLKHAASMHDIGKVGIPDHIMQKPHKLTAEEFNIVKSHTIIGANILKGLKSPVTDMARRVAISHHEKWDGSGYPSGIKRERIPIEGRIVSLADVFDALTSKRPYKQAYPFNKTIEIIKNESGKSFDPEVVSVFMKSCDELMELKEEVNGQHQSTPSDFQLSARDQVRQ
jgi:putative two-component system response regulator